MTHKIKIACIWALFIVAIIFAIFAFSGLLKRGDIPNDSDANALQRVNLESDARTNIMISYISMLALAVLSHWIVKKHHDEKVGAPKTA